MPILALVGYLAQRCAADPLTILVCASVSIAGIDDRDGLRVGPLPDPRDGRSHRAPGA